MTTDRGVLQRLQVVVTGSPSAVDVPVNLYVLQQMRPELEIRVVLTRSAQRFVTAASLRYRSHAGVEVDEWSEGPEASHVELGSWADAIVVFPATLDYLARVASGRGDSPSVLAIQCTSNPVVFSPALPPGGLRSRAYRMHWEALSGVPNFGVVPPRHATSVSTGEVVLGGPGEIGEVLHLVDELLACCSPADDAR